MLDQKTDLAGMLSDPTLLETRGLIAGDWVAADDGATFDVINPARGDVVARVADFSRTETARAIEAAEAARHAWAARPAKERAQILRKWYDLMVANTEDLAIILTAEMGKPLAESRGEIAYGASFVEWFGEEPSASMAKPSPGIRPTSASPCCASPSGSRPRSRRGTFPMR